MLPLGVIHPAFPLIRESVGARVLSRLARSRESNLTVPSRACPGVFMLGECTNFFLLGSVSLLLLLVFFCIPVHIWLRPTTLSSHIWLRPTTLTMCAQASVVWFHGIMSVYIEREPSGIIDNFHETKKHSYDPPPPTHPIRRWIDWIDC